VGQYSIGADSVVVEEYKPASERDELDEKYPGKYNRLPDGNYTSDAINRVLNPMGIGFSLRFSDEISTIGHRNRRLLYTFLQPHAEQFYLPKMQTLLEIFEAVPSKTIAELVEGSADIDELHWAIAHGRLYVDLNAALLTTQRSQVQVFRDVEALQAWTLAIRPDGTRPGKDRLTGEYRFSPGDTFTFDGQRMTITIVGATALYTVTDRGEHITIAYTLLYAAHRAGKVVLPDCARPDGKDSRFWRASPKALERAVCHAGVIESIDRGEDLPPDLRYSPRTIRRWRAAIRDGIAKGMSPVESLIDENDQKGFHGSHVDQTFSAKLDKWTRDALKDRLNKSLLAMYFDIKKMAEEDGHQMIVKSCFYERVAKLKSIETLRSSEGHKRAYPHMPAFWMLERETPVHCERPLELVHFDSTLLDIELRSSISGEVLGRPWLSIAVCANTRRVVGMYLSFRPPSYISSMMLLADIVKRFGRLPDAVIHDWGSEFKSKDFKYALSALFIKRYVRPKSAPRFGAILERMFGIVTQEFISNTPRARMTCYTYPC